MHHRRHVGDWIAQHRAFEHLRVLPDEVRAEEPAVGAPHDAHAIGISHFVVNRATRDRRAIRHVGDARRAPDERLQRLLAVPGASSVVTVRHRVPERGEVRHGGDVPRRARRVRSAVGQDDQRLGTRLVGVVAFGSRAHDDGLYRRGRVGVLVAAVARDALARHRRDVVLERRDGVHGGFRGGAGVRALHARPPAKLLVFERLSKPRDASLGDGPGRRSNRRDHPVANVAQRPAASAAALDVRVVLGVRVPVADPSALSDGGGGGDSRRRARLEVHPHDRLARAPRRLQHHIHPGSVLARQPGFHGGRRRRVHARKRAASLGDVDDGHDDAFLAGAVGGPRHRAKRRGGEVRAGLHRAFVRDERECFAVRGEPRPHRRRRVFGDSRRRRGVRRSRGRLGDWRFREEKRRRSVETKHETESPTGGLEVVDIPEPDGAHHGVALLPGTLRGRPHGSARRDGVGGEPRHASHRPGRDVQHERGGLHATHQLFAPLLAPLPLALPGFFAFGGGCGGGVPAEVLAGRFESRLGDAHAPLGGRSVPRRFRDVHDATFARGPIDTAERTVAAERPVRLGGNEHLGDERAALPYLERDAVSIAAGVFPRADHQPSRAGRGDAGEERAALLDAERGVIEVVAGGGCAGGEREDGDGTSRAIGGEVALGRDDVEGGRGGGIARVANEGRARAGGDRGEGFEQGRLRGDVRGVVGRVGIGSGGRGGGGGRRRAGGRHAGTMRCRDEGGRAAGRAGGRGRDAGAAKASRGDGGRSDESDGGAEDRRRRRRRHASDVGRVADGSAGPWSGERPTRSSCWSSALARSSAADIWTLLIGPEADRE